MKHAAVWAAMATVATLAPAFADDQPAFPEPYVPSLGDIMTATQVRHFKLWSAGGAGNWALAGYEFARIKASFRDAMRLYPGIPDANMTKMTEPAEEIRKSIEAKDVTQFARAFEGLTAACNACHQSIGVGFIDIRVPPASQSTASPLSNQSFAPK
jgi:hypothetical protein